jgi:hypothetical protein
LAQTAVWNHQAYLAAAFGESALPESKKSGHLDSSMTIHDAPKKAAAFRRPLWV